MNLDRSIGLLFPSNFLEDQLIWCIWVSFSSEDVSGSRRVLDSPPCHLFAQATLAQMGPRIEAKITVDTPTEAELGYLDGHTVICPVVSSGKALKGEITLSLPSGQKAKFHEVKLCLRSYVVEQDGIQGIEDDLQEAVAIKIPLEPTRSYELDGEIKVPFTIDAEALPAYETFNSANLMVRHVIDLKAKGGFLGGGVSAEQPLVVQLPSPMPNASAKVRAPWITIGDCGGVVKLELCGSETVEVRVRLEVPTQLPRASCSDK